MQRERWRGAVVTHLTCNQKIPSSILGVSLKFYHFCFPAIRPLAIAIQSFTMVWDRCLVLDGCSFCSNGRILLVLLLDSNTTSVLFLDSR